MAQQSDSLEFLSEHYKFKAYCEAACPKLIWLLYLIACTSQKNYGPSESELSLHHSQQAAW